MRRLLREPLFHFLLIGAGLFLLYGWLQGGLLSSPKEIVVSAGQVQGLQLQFERAWRRPPTAKEVQGLIDSWVREEIFYREGLAMGLDRDDPIVRRRIGQKVEFLVDGMLPRAPTVEELQGWLDSHPDRYRSETLHSLRQVYFDASRHGERLQADVAKALNELREGKEVPGDASHPDFDPAQRAFYYLRVLEIPTPRWTAYDSYRYGVPLAKGDSGIHQERAYTSPIWYTP